MKQILNIGPEETSPRIQNLIDGLYKALPAVESERALLITKSYKETEALPMVLRRAKALEYILENMTLVIRDSELIVGNLTTAPRSTQIFPEFSNKWLLDEFDSLAQRKGDVFYHYR
ncbi:pyruvate formate lyase family protein [Lacrimispora xylanisolvens]|uniref:pyruvate formate lyase family protein n=1 Tax=Lacrimispora xylanisolvens TaxID=384636 RepID=UPI0024029DEE